MKGKGMFKTFVTAVLCIIYCFPVCAGKVDKRYNPDYKKGNDFFSAGNFDKAIEMYDKVLGKEPKNAHAFVARGNAYAKKGSYQEASADFTAAVSLDPQYG
mgnify:CR=1 FL=1